MAQTDIKRIVPGRSGGRADNVDAALNEWKRAVRYFESVNEPELVDFAIYEMEAARRKYMFLLRHARDEA